MLNSIKKILNINNIYQDISTVYDIVGINDNCILISKQGKISQIHIYNIEPVTILNITQRISSNIIDTYTAFLRSMNYDFQIYIENNEVNINNYLSNIVIDDNNINRNKLAEVYRNELKKSLKDNNIYIPNYYIIVTIKKDSELDQISKNICSLSRTGVYVKKITGKLNLDKFLYSMINKVDNIC